MKDNVITLEELVSSKVREGRRTFDVLREVWNNVRIGSLRLEDPKPPLTPVEYVIRLDYSLWFWTSIVLVVSTLLLVYTTEIVPQLLPLRYVLGTLFVLFLPGYAVVELLYPEEKSLTPLERTALSIGLSLAIVPLVGLLLNYSPWGIRLTPIVSSLSILVVSTLVGAIYRKYERLKLEVRFRSRGFRR